MNKTIFRIGPIRPPSEANSLLLQITEGCTWNRCKFCELYKNSRFRAFTVESIKEDIDVMADYATRALRHQRPDGTWDHQAVRSEMEHLPYEEQNCYHMICHWLTVGGKTVFLQDGNSLALKPERVVEVLDYLRKTFPSIERVTTYGRAETLSKISVAEYRALRQAGLDRIHSGFESGADRVLALINKGVTAEQEIQAGRSIKAAEIELSVYFMPGIGGKALSRENALETARVVRAIDPDFVRIRSAVVKPGTGLWQDLQEGTYQLCSEDDKVTEIRLLIEHTRGCGGFLASDHIINLLQEVEGRLREDGDHMLHVIDQYLSMPEDEQKLFQLARRSGWIATLQDFYALSSSRIGRLSEVASQVSGEDDWNELVNEMMARYI